jgi:catalase
MKAPIERENNYAQAGERYRSMPKWERDDLVLNLITLLGQCDKRVQEKMIWQLRQCDADYGRRVAEGLGLQT